MTTSHESTLTNADRSERLQTALEFFYDASLFDVLADARHRCDGNGQSYAELDRIAYRHYLAEINEESRRSV
jgi:hypothetical protein